MKELEVDLGRDQEQFKIDRAKLVTDKTEFEVKSKDMVVVSSANDEWKARLKGLEDPLQEEEKKLDERIHKYNTFDSQVKGRENVARQKEAEQKLEGLQLDIMKQRLLAIVGKRKAPFNDRTEQLYEQITKMDVSYTELLHDIAGKEEISSMA